MVWRASGGLKGQLSHCAAGSVRGRVCIQRMSVANIWYAGWVSMGRTQEGRCLKRQLRRARLASLGTLGHEALSNLEGWRETQIQFGSDDRALEWYWSRPKQHWRRALRRL